ncbi:unnamed protein product [Cylindrotheca closterium]|uniref:Uncharacterized protein n=1 Tax=Cylindrotheca closterium TaxID=2856 RepID=A0AAD2JPV5_9STRA|nr:unnamed protein product [Cylindrotheca closterium]
MEHFSIEVDDQSPKVGGKQRLSTPDGWVIPMEIVNGLPHVRMRPPTKCELETLPHIVLTSDKDWDPSVLDSKLEDFEKWAESIPDNGSEEGDRPFDRVSILKSNKTVTTLKDESLLDQALDFFESFDYFAPTDGLFKVYERPDTDTDWFGCNMADLFRPDSYFDDPPNLAAFEVNQSHRRPSILFAPEAPIDFDIETGPLLAKDDFRDLAPGLPKDMLTLNVLPIVMVIAMGRELIMALRHKPSKNTNLCYQLLQSIRSLMNAIGSDCDDTLHALSVNRHNESLATNTVYADMPDIEHGHVSAQFYLGLSSLVSNVYVVTLDAQFLQTLQDNIRKRGAPFKLVSDQAQAQVSKAVKDYLRWLCIDDWQSEIRSASTDTDPNKRLHTSDGEDLSAPTIIKSRNDKSKVQTVVYSSDDKSDSEDVIVENSDLIGRTFLLKPDKEDYVRRAEIVELIDKHEHNTTNKPEHIPFCVSSNKGEYNDIMAYNEILERLEADMENPIVWKFKQIVSHQGPL